jgi:hypothetical protein
MEDAKQLWSLWQQNLTEFQPAFTGPGWLRFVQWTTATALCDEEHTITQEALSAGLPGQWRNLERMAEYGAWDAEALEQTLMRLVDRELSCRLGRYRPVAVDDTKEMRGSRQVWGVCTFKHLSRNPKHPKLVAGHNWVVMGDLCPSSTGSSPWTYLPTGSRLYLRQAQLPAGETFRTKNELSVEMLRELSGVSEAPVLGIFDGGYARASVVRPCLSGGPQFKRIDVLTRPRGDARLYRPLPPPPEPKDPPPLGDPRSSAGPKVGKTADKKGSQAAGRKNARKAAGKVRRKKAARGTRQRIHRKKAALKARKRSAGNKIHRTKAARPKAAPKAARKNVRRKKTLRRKAAPSKAVGKQVAKPRPGGHKGKHKGGRPRKWGRRIAAPRDHRRWNAPWQSGQAWVYGKMRTFRCKAVDCRWSVSGPDVPVRALVFEVEGYDKPWFIVTSALDLTAAQVLEAYAARFRQEDGIRDHKQRLGMEQVRAWTKAPVLRTFQVQLITMTLLRLMGAAMERTAGPGWCAPPPWNPHKTRVSILDLRRLLWRHRAEFSQFMREMDEVPKPDSVAV